MRNFLLIFLFSFNFLALPNRSVDAQNNETEIRALWVTRWDYSSPEDIRNIVKNAAAFRFNLLLFQVRGNATVFYSSNIEPWAREMGGSDPGWNPLKMAIAEAHEVGIQLHAWINVLPGWRGDKPPQNQKQIYRAHPDWFMTDESGNPMPLNSHYVWLNPIHPDVQKYLKSVIFELSDTPGLDGIHFDYFRYPGPGCSYDRKSLELFTDKYHIQPQDSTRQWNKFRREALTNLLRDVYLTVKAKHPGFVFSSAVIGDYDIAQRVFLQESHRWLAEGIIDIIFPMTYTGDLSMFTRWLKRHAVSLPGHLICPGLMIYPDKTLLQKQIKIARAQHFSGFSLFAYSNLFREHLPNDTAIFLSDSIFTRPAKLPDLTTRQPKHFISQVHRFPRFPTTEDSIRIVCKITGVQTSSRLRVVSIWQDEKFQSLNRFRMRQIAKKPEYWYTPAKVPPQQAGDTYFLRIVAYNPQDTTLFPITSDPRQIIVDTPVQMFGQNVDIGPPLTLASKAAIDRQGNIWIYEPNKGLRVFSAAGEEKPFSPIISYTDQKGHLNRLTNVAGLATPADNQIAVLVDKNGSAVVLSGDNRSGRLRPFCSLPQPGTNFAVDGRNRFFVLQKKGWYIADAQGNLMNRFQFTGVHSPNNIAVTPGGEYVFVACRTEGQVHVWFKTGSGPYLNYRAKDNLLCQNIGMGGVSCGGDGTVFLAATPSGSVRVLNSNLETIDFIQGGKPAVQAPRLAIASPDERFVIILEVGGTTPVRMHKWEKQNHKGH